jgi:uncharacterized protein (DUF1919 family)
MLEFIKQILKKTHRGIVKHIFNFLIEKKDFCIISNDCWGAELYRWMGIEYNTPFVGLMFMAPCYLKFLKNPNKYISGQLEFITNSQYEEPNNVRRETGYYPIGKILDIEVHFLHFKSEEEAIEKWNRRKVKINWNNLFVKFSLDKDYAEKIHLDEFESLPYKRKVCFSKFDHANSEICVKVKRFTHNGKILFKKCMREFDIVGWINDGRIHLKGTRKILGLILYHSIIY